VKVSRLEFALESQKPLQKKKAVINLAQQKDGRVIALVTIQTEKQTSCEDQRQR